MSEYQYYEFVAIDEPLTPKQMAELRARSSRASITPTSFVNEYQWGDLKGDPVDWMRRYFDAHIYVANWCTCLLCLRVPKSAFNAEILRDFKTETTFSFKQTKTHWLLEWMLDESDNYERFAEEDGRGWMGRLAPLRYELLRGDMRPLYLGWLAWQREQQPVAKPQMRRRTVAELYKLAVSVAETRKKQEAVRRKKADAKQQAKRETYLRTLAADFDQCWRIADEQAARGIASAYDEVKRALVDLSDAYALCATRTDFDRKLVQFMVRHGKRGALVRRLADAGLWKKASR